MTTLGKSLTFYMRYFPEMEELYVGENYSLLEGKDDMPAMKEMVKKVGNLACEQAKEFLLEAAARVVQTFEPMCNVEISSKDKNVQSSWSVAIWYWRKGRRLMEPSKKWQFSIDLNQYKGTPSVICSLWIKGGLAKEKELSAILREKVVVDSRKMGVEYGNVIIGVITVPTGKGEDYEIEKQPLLEEVSRCFSRISKEEINKILSL